MRKINSIRKTINKRKNNELKKEIEKNNKYMRIK